jgi:CubicO group peptidase (beta-lactamase class C family)
VHRNITASIVVVCALLFGQETSAQSLTLSLLGQYLDALREQAAIPGMSGVVLQDGVPARWYAFGRQDVDTNERATTATPYFINGLTQTLGSTMLLKRCVEDNGVAISERVASWNPAFAEPEPTIADLLAHRSRTGAFLFDPSRFAALTPILEQCADVPFAQVLETEVFGRLGMTSSVPSRALAGVAPAAAPGFDAATLQRYTAVMQRVATPYRVDRGGRATRSEHLGAPPTMADGVISTVEDLARFDAAVSHDVLIHAPARIAAWTNVAGLPTGLGWFVQGYNGEPVVWQFGVAKDAYSSMIIKLPSRDITLILLANSDGLSAPFALDKGDVTASPFARTFLRLITGS